MGRDVVVWLVEERYSETWVPLEVFIHEELADSLVEISEDADPAGEYRIRECSPKRKRATVTPIRALS